MWRSTSWTARAAARNLPPSLPRSRESRKRRKVEPMPSKRPPKKRATAASVKLELEEVGLRPSRDKGQSFLRDELVAERQVLAAAVCPGERVLEVGGGLGVLTREVSERRAIVHLIELEAG